MPEKKLSWSFPIGKSKRIAIMNGTREVKAFVPDPNADVIIDLTVTEITPTK